MLTDMIELFRKYGNIENIVFDNYTPSKGLYIRIKDGSIEDTMLVDKGETIDKNYEWFLKADYYSSLIDMNKAVDTKKKVHSNNLYSLFIKHDILPYVGKSDKALSMEDLNESISRYFNALSDIKNENKELLKQISISELDIEKLNSNRDWLLKNFESIIDFVKGFSLPNNSYVKIFFYEDIEKYADESKRYLVPRIFNKNDYNIKLNDIILGLSNYNMGMNAKKPYLEHMTTKYRVPFRITLNDAVILKNIFEWLEGQRDEEGNSVNRAFISEKFNFKDSVDKPRSGHYFYFVRGTETIVKDYDYIPRYEDRIVPLDINDIFELPEWKYANTLSKRYELEEVVDYLFFGGRLRRNYYTEVKDLPSPSIKNNYSRGLENLMITYRKSLNDYFCKSCDVEISSYIDKLSLEVVKEYVKMASGLNFYKACGAFNLRIALLNYFKVRGEEDMGDIILELSEKIRKKMHDKDNIVCCEDDREFYFASGQLARYMLSLSEARNLKHSSTEGLLRSKDAAMLKTKLKDLYFLYGHKIILNNIRFNNIMAMIMGYMTEACMKDYEDYFMAGLMSKSIIYEKKEEGVNNENDK